MSHEFGCETGQDLFSSRQPCFDAGGFLRDGRLRVGKWGNTPCGCYLNLDGSIVWDTKNGGCQNEGHFQPVCKRHTYTYEAIREQYKCDEGFELSYKDCEKGAKLFNHSYTLRTGQWKDKPCGCSRYERMRTTFPSMNSSLRPSHLLTTC